MGNMQSDAITHNASGLHCLPDDLIHYVLSFAPAKDIANFTATTKRVSPQPQRNDNNRFVISAKFVKDLLMKRIKNPLLINQEIFQNNAHVKLSKMLQSLHYRECILNPNFQPKFDSLTVDSESDGSELFYASFMLAESENFIINSADDFDPREGTAIADYSCAVVRSRCSLQILGFIPEQHCFNIEIYNSPKLGEYLIRSNSSGIFATQVLQNIRKEGYVQRYNTSNSKIISSLCLTCVDMQGNMIVGSSDNIVRLFRLDDDIVNPDSPKMLSWEFMSALESEAHITDVALDVDRKVLAAVDSFFRLHIWNYEKGIELQTNDCSFLNTTEEDPYYDMLELELVMKEGYVIVGCNSGKIGVFCWNGKLFELQRTLEDQSFVDPRVASLGVLRCSMDLFYGVLITSDGRGCGLSIYDLSNDSTTKPTRVLSEIHAGGHQRPYDTFGLVRWSYDGSRIYLPVFGGSMYVWSFSS